MLPRSLSLRKTELFTTKAVKIPDPTVLKTFLELSCFHRLDSEGSGQCSLTVSSEYYYLNTTIHKSLSFIKLIAYKFWNFFQWLFQPIQGPGLLFSSVSFSTDGRTPWTSVQLVARPLPKHRTTQTQNKLINTQNIHALSEIRTHSPSVRASEYSSFLRPYGYCDRHKICRRRSRKTKCFNAIYIFICTFQ
jgi:hypothetical protein